MIFFKQISIISLVIFDRGTGNRIDIKVTKINIDTHKILYMAFSLITPIHHYNIILICRRNYNIKLYFGGKMSKYNYRKVISSLSKSTGLPLNLIGNNPLLQLCSDNELIIEKAKNIEFYDENCIKISVHNNKVTVNGQKLVLQCLSNNNLSVTGVIEEIRIERLLS